MALRQPRRLGVPEIQERDAQVGAAQRRVGGEQGVQGVVEKVLQLGRRSDRGEVVGRAGRLGARRRRESNAARMQDGAERPRSGSGPLMNRLSNGAP